jgi:hypothetical protein
MAISSQPIKAQLLELIGAIVLSTQDAEKYLKAIIPFTDSQDPSIRGALSRHEKLKKRTLGDLVGKFMGTATSENAELEKHLAHLVDQRNKIVHHFSETYGEQLRAGESQLVIDSLRLLLVNIEAFRSTLEQMAILLFEAIRDTTFLGTPEYKDMDDLCATFRLRVAS